MRTNILGQRLKLLRQEAGLTQEEFGKPYSLRKSTISQYESGDSRPDDELKKQIALDYNVSLDWLMGLSDTRMLCCENLDISPDSLFSITDITSTQEIGRTNREFSNKELSMLGNKIKKLREEKNITQANLAKLLDVSPSTVGMWEQNRRTPDIEILKKLSDILNVSVDYLIGKSIIKESADILFNKTPTTFSERLKSLRKKYKLTQKQLAEKFYLDDSSISKYENGKALPENELLQNLADFFNVSVDYLLGRTEIKNTLSKKDSIDIEKEAEEIIENINKLDTIKFCGTSADEEDKEYLKLVSERFLSDIRVYNKQKYTTPKKNSIEEELEAYRAELEAEEKEKTLSALEKQNENLNQKHA